MNQSVNFHGLANGRDLGLTDLGISYDDIWPYELPDYWTKVRVIGFQTQGATGSPGLRFVCPSHVAPQSTDYREGTVQASTGNEYGGQLPPSIDNCFDELSTRAIGWDGFKARPIDRQAIFKAKSLLRFLATQGRNEGISVEDPRIGATRHGSVHLQWENGQISVSVEVSGGDEPFSLYGEYADGRSFSSDAASTSLVWKALTHLSLQFT